MPKSKRQRRKQYTPKLVSANSMNWAMAGAYVLPTEKRNEIYGPVALAFDALRAREASHEDWYTINNALSLSEALIELSIGNNLAQQIREGRDALHAVGNRLRATGSSTCHATELALILEATKLFRIQLRLCSQAEMSKAVRHVQNVITSGGARCVANIMSAP